MRELEKIMGGRKVILQKPSATIAIRVDLSAIQRKYYDAMLYIAKQELRNDINKKIFTVPFKELQSVLDKEERNKNHKYYIDRLKELKKKEAEYNILDKDKGLTVNGWISLISYLQVVSKGDDILNVTFEIPEKIKEAITDPKGLYANINLVVIRGLKSKYSIILYELVKDYEKVEVPEMTIEDFKKLFNIEDKYQGRIDNLKKKVLDPAIEELNNNENVDFLVSYELKKRANKYTHIKFHVRKKPFRLENKRLGKNAIIDNANSNGEKSLLKDTAKEIIDYLNQKTGKRYKHNNETYLRLISGRLREGYTVDDFKRVIDNKCNDWLNTDMEKYLRPSTLFSKSHFDDYLNQITKSNQNKSQGGSLWETVI